MAYFPDFGILAQLLINGILLGGLYALVAFGLSVIYGVAGILNFAHGTILAMISIAAAILFESLGLPLAVILLVLTPAGFLFGWVFHKVLLSPLQAREQHQRTIGTVLVTVGALIIIGDVTAVLAGAEQRVIRLSSIFFEIGSVIVSGTQIGILVAVSVSMIALHLFLVRSWTGASIRAVAQNRIGAALCGADASNTSAMTFAIGASIVAIAGVLYVISYPVNPYSGFPLTVKAFSIILLGGVGNLPGTLVAGLFLGVAEAFVAFYWAPQWAPAISIIIVLGGLLLFPGLARTRRAA
ncbi:MAG: hypothetical protein CL534_04020 [Ahrensia sp.]|nr:hypothetical protein [Ahrensia sp.]